jgi:hypothetical protein
VSLTATRSHDAAFTYEQMRAVAKASAHDKTVAVKQEMVWGGDPHYWPGEPVVRTPAEYLWIMCRGCEEDVPLCDFVGDLDGTGRCLDCHIRERRP